MPIRSNAATFNLWRIKRVIPIRLFSIASNAWYTNLSTPVNIDWTFIYFYEALKDMIVMKKITSAKIQAQLAASAGTAYLQLYDYTAGEVVTELSTTNIIKGIYTIKELNLEDFINRVLANHEFVLRAYNLPGGTGYYTYVGSVTLWVEVVM